MGIGIVSLMGSKDELEPQVYRSYMGKVFLCIAFLLGLLITTPWFLQHYENSIYNDRIILSERSRFQKIVFTRNKSDIRLFLDGNLQFSSLDEYRYHESLIHTAMLATSNHHKILMLGGGDGLGLKEVLKYDSVGEVHLVDIDRQLVDICRQREFMTELNHNSLNSKKVQLIHTDAMGYLQDSAHLYNVIIADLPDPNHTSLARLYSVEFYRLIEKHLAADGVFSTQATSPFYARQSFSCIIKTLGASPFKTVLPFETYIPSFGQWGFALAYKHKGQLEFSDLTKFKLNTKYLDSTQFKKIGHLDKDVSPLEVKVNHMDRPIILEYYQNDWQHWN
jgi:spermidine synthase